MVKPGSQIAGIFIFLSFIFLVACTAETESSSESIAAVPIETVLVTAVNATATAVPAKPTSVTEEPTVTATSMPVEPTATLTSIPEIDAQEEEIAQIDGDGCLNCHSDKDLLIENTAPEEEKPPSESSGVG